MQFDLGWTSYHSWPYCLCTDRGKQIAIKGIIKPQKAKTLDNVYYTCEVRDFDRLDQKRTNVTLVLGKTFVEIKGGNFTIQFRVLANLLANAWIQYATSARGRTTDVAANISDKKTKRKKTESKDKSWYRNSRTCHRWKKNPDLHRKRIRTRLILYHLTNAQTIKHRA